MEQYLDGLLGTLVYLASSFILFFIGKIVYQFFHRGVKVNHELVEKDNLAFALGHVGYFIGLVMVIGGVLLGETKGIEEDMIIIFTYGLTSIVLLNIAVIINDKLILKNFSIKKEIIEDQNAGTGIVEAANAIATGMIIMGSVYGEGGGFFTLIPYWLIGQLLLILTSYVYNWITPYDIHEHIEKDNVAVGIGFAGAIIAIGNLIRNALMHDFDSWIVTLEDISYEVALGLLFLPLARLAADKILLPGQKLTDEIVNQEKPNIGAAIVEAFAYVGGSVLITWSIG